MPSKKNPSLVDIWTGRISSTSPCMTPKPPPASRLSMPVSCLDARPKPKPTKSSNPRTKASLAIITPILRRKTGLNLRGRKKARKHKIHIRIRCLASILRSTALGARTSARRILDKRAKTDLSLPPKSLYPLSIKRTSNNQRRRKCYRQRNTAVAVRIAATTTARPLSLRRASCL